MSGLGNLEDRLQKRLPLKPGSDDTKTLHHYDTIELQYKHAKTKDDPQADSLQTRNNNALTDPGTNFFLW